MSEHSALAVVSSAMSQAVAATVVNERVSMLVADYEFGFRGRGGVSRIAFERSRFKWTQTVPDVIPSVDLLNESQVLAALQKYNSFSISGSIRLPGAIHLYDVDVMLFQTANPDRPFYLVCRLDTSLYRNVYGEDDEFDGEAARRLLALTIRLGASDSVDAFQLFLLPSLAEVHPFDQAGLTQLLLRPASVQDLASRAVPPSGLVMGLKLGALSAADRTRIQEVWADFRVMTTTNGFLVVGLTEIDDGDDGDDERGE